MQLVKSVKSYYYYKSYDFVPDGDYILFNGKPTDSQKKGYRMIAAQSVADRAFKWLIPYEKWVIGFADETPSESNWSCDVPLREWQRTFLDKWYGTTSSFGLVVGIGGGKTLVGLEAIKHAENPLVVCPRYLFQTWKDEAKKWGYKTPRLTTYESVHKQDTADIVVIDEVLALKNPDSQRHKRIKEFCTNSRVLAMTGTPVGAKGALDWRWLLSLKDEAVPYRESQWKWLCGVNTRIEKVTDAVSAVVIDGWYDDRVSKLVTPHIYTVDTSDLIADLPEVTYESLWTECPAKWKACLSGVMGEQYAACRTISDGFVYTEGGCVKRFDENKIKVIVDLVENFGEPVVIFAAWKETQDALLKALSEYNPAIVRAGENTTEDFTSGKTDVIICSVKMASGMNLQRARIAIFASNGTNPTDRKQAIGRVYRQGQKRGVVVYDVMAKGTLDYMVKDALERHQNVSDSFIKSLIEKEIEKNAGY